MSIAKDLQDKFYNEYKETGAFPKCIHINSPDFMQLWYELEMPIDPELPFKRGLVGKIFGIDLYVDKEGEKTIPRPDKLSRMICGACKAAIMLRYELKKAQGDYNK